MRVYIIESNCEEFSQESPLERGVSLDIILFAIKSKMVKISGKNILRLLETSLKTQVRNLYVKSCFIELHFICMSYT